MIRPAQLICACELECWLSMRELEAAVKDKAKEGVQAVMIGDLHATPGTDTHLGANGIRPTV